MRPSRRSAKASISSSGPAIRELEASVAEYSHCSYGVGVSSGTDALLLALMALDIGAGDEVVTSSYTFFATGGTIARSGARPVFLDIDPVSFNLSPAILRDFLERQCERRDGALVNRATGGRVRALMPVHLYGQLADMDALMSIAREYRPARHRRRGAGHRQRRCEGPAGLQLR